MTSSSLRYADNLAATLTKAPADAGGAIVGCEAFGPMSIEDNLELGAYLIKMAIS